MSGAVAPWVSRRADEHDVACRAFFEDDRLIYLHERPDDRAVCVPSVRGHSTPNSSGTTGRASRGAAGETAASGSPVVQGRIAYRRLPPAWRRVDAWRCPGRRAAPSRQCSPRRPAQPLPGEALVATGLSGLGAAHPYDTRARRLSCVEAVSMMVMATPCHHSSRSRRLRVVLVAHRRPASDSPPRAGTTP
jgi:hypothetical protein